MERDSSPEERLLNLIKGKRKSAFPPEYMVKPKKEEETVEPTAIEKKRKEAETEKKLSQVKERIEKELAAAQPSKETPREKEGKLGATEQEGKPRQSNKDKGRQPGPVKEKKKIEAEEKKTPKQNGDKKEEPPSAPSKRPRFSFNKTHLYITGGVLFLAVAGFAIFKGSSSRETEEIQNLQSLIASISQETEVKPSGGEKQEAGPDKALKKPTQPKDATSFADYQKLLKDKSIFAPAADRSKTTVSQEINLREIIKDLKLVGIVPGDEPQAIIEDKKSAQTFFLKEGELIEGVEIKKISAGKVILGYGEETITLSL